MKRGTAESPDELRVRAQEVEGLEKRLVGVRELKAAAERTGAVGSVKLLTDLEGDVGRLLAQARAQKGTRVPLARFTPDTCAKIIMTVREGLWPAHAADLSGVPRSTVATWEMLGMKDPKGPFGQFAQDLAEARSDQTRQMFTRALELAKQGDGKLLVDLLARRDPKHFLPPQKIEIELEGAKEALLEAASKVLSHAQFAKLLSALGADGEEVSG